MDEERDKAYADGYYDGLRQGRQSAALSSRDAEVREVLKNLRTETTPENCWCSDIYPHSAGRGSHAKWCLAARVLYAKLQPGKEGEDALVLE